MKKYVLSLDQGTTSSRALLFDKKGMAIAIAQKEFTQVFPKPGWVEHDGLEIWNVQRNAIRQVMKMADVKADEIACIGITNQRETTILWDKETGDPVYNAIVWQSRQTTQICEEMKKMGLSDHVKKTTGLVIDAYFSLSKVKWILDNVPEAKRLLLENRLLFGTMDTWLLWNLTNGKVHATEVSNASRTMMYDINNLCWDEKILNKLYISREILPEVKDSSTIFGYANIDGVSIPISGMAGDQQAALFGQRCFDVGDIKNTYGTGCFILMNTGSKKVISKNGLLSTIGWSIDKNVTYALEGSVFNAGSVINWLRDEMGILEDVNDSEYFASSIKDTKGVYFIPAFSGLGTPYWDMYAKGAILGLTRGAGKKEIIRAGLESIAYRTKDVVDVMEKDSSIDIGRFKVDGGVSRNSFLMQFQANLLKKNVIKPKMTETTALGAAFLAGLATGFWESIDEIRKIDTDEKIYVSENTNMDMLYKGWKDAVDMITNGEKT